MTPIIFNIIPPILSYPFIANISQHYTAVIDVATAPYTEQRGGYRHAGMDMHAWEADVYACVFY